MEQDWVEITLRVHGTFKSDLWAVERVLDTHTKGQLVRKVRSFYEGSDFDNLTYWREQDKFILAVIVCDCERFRQKMSK